LRFVSGLRGIRQGAAFTCRGLDDNPETDEVGAGEITFGGQVNAEVASGRDTTKKGPIIE